jgi:nucleoside-diphosphate-sugar epimerase
MTRTLVLGGTAWLGRLVATDARDRGHDVTCLARGESGPGPDGVRLVRGDRSRPDAYAGLDGQWDLVLDVSRVPSHVRGAVEALGDRAGHWTFVSSGSAYADQSGPLEESSPLLPPGEDAAPYGEAKVACERALPAGALVVRAGLLAGPGDPSDRSGYYVARMAAAVDAPVLVPDVADQPMQVLDVRDLAVWLVDLAEARSGGPVHAAGTPSTVGELVELSAQVAGHRAGTVPAAPAWLREHGVQEWAGDRSLPWWLPPSHHGMGRLTVVEAERRGLRPRPLEQTLADVLDDEARRGLERPRRAGLSRADEADLLGRLAG